MADRLVFVVREGGLVEPQEASAPLTSLRLREDCIASLRRFRESGFGLVLLIDGVNGSEAAASTATATSAAARDGESGDSADTTGSDRQTFLSALLASQGVVFDAVRTCTHARSAGCDCALPGIGLVADYIADPALDRGRSIVVGGNETPGLARAMGLCGFVASDSSGWPDIVHEVLERPRRATVLRRTRETDIRVEVDLDRAAMPRVSTGLGFFDHMLEQLGKHGGFELGVECTGDLEVDEHHTIEDVALALGQALKEALGDKRGIARYGFVLPMDEAEAQVAIDLSGRPYIVFDGEFPRESVGGLPTELVGHFFRSLAESLGAAIHISVRGENAHHMVEACFKGVARTLRQAFARSGSDLPSTKGSL